MKQFSRFPAVLLSLALFLTLLVAGVPSADEVEHVYIGSKKCKKCHLKQYKSWAQTKMASSFEALKPGERTDAKKAAGLDPAKDYTTDETCLPCHTTGYGKEGGFVDIESTPNLAGTGCEMCHGAGGSYVQDQYMSNENKSYKKADVVAMGLVEVVREEQCLQCHNTDSPFVGDDYEFDFEENKEKGTHEHFALKYEH